MSKGISDFSPQELVALAGSLAIALNEKFDEKELSSIKCFLSALQSNLSLLDVHNKGCYKQRCGKK